MKRLVAALVLAGCAHEPLMQGNVLDAEKVQAIAPGMTRAEVVELLGAPVYADRLHPHRLVYVELRKQHGEMRKRRVIVYLDEAGRVVRVER